MEDLEDLALAGAFDPPSQFISLTSMQLMFFHHTVISSSPYTLLPYFLTLLLHRLQLCCPPCNCFHHLHLAPAPLSGSDLFFTLSFLAHFRHSKFISLYSSLSLTISLNSESCNLFAMLTSYKQLQVSHLHRHIVRT